MMFQTIQTIYFLWGYDPGNMSVSFIAGLSPVYCWLVCFYFHLQRKYLFSVDSFFISYITPRKICNFTSPPHPIWSGLQDISQILASSRRAQWGPTIRIRLKNSDFPVKRGTPLMRWWAPIQNIRLGGSRHWTVEDNVAFPNMRIQIHPHLISSLDRGKNRTRAFRVDFYAGNFITCSYFGPWMR